MENDQAMSHAALEDEKLEGSKPSTVEDTKVDSPYCKVKNSNKSEDTNTSTADERTRADFSNMSLDTERGEESNTRHESTAEPPIWVKIENAFRQYNEGTLAENYNFMGYPTPILTNDLLKRQLYHKMIDRKQFLHEAFLAFGLANFMSYAAHFCKYEAQNKAEIISIGSRNGAVDREIISTYRKYFGEEIKITLVDPNPDYKVDFKTVDDLLEARPEAFGNCILLIIWPEAKRRNDGYDIAAVRKLQPLAALVLYEPTGLSASREFTSFLRRKTNKEIFVDCLGKEYEEPIVEWENYAAEEVTGLLVYRDAGDEFEISGEKCTTEPATPHLALRLVKLKKL